MHYPVPIHLQPAARDLGHRPDDFPVTRELADRVLSLPIYPEHDRREQRAIVIAGVRCLLRRT